MSKTKNIEEEIREAEIKNGTILTETDVNNSTEESKAITETKVKIFKKEYKLTELIELTSKKNKSYDENEIIKKFKLLMKNYYTGIAYAILRPCCGRNYTLKDFKNKLKEKDSYRMIDIRCSRDNLRFDKSTVDIIIEYVEKNKIF